MLAAWPGSAEIDSYVLELRKALGTGRYQILTAKPKELPSKSVRLTRCTRLVANHKSNLKLATKFARRTSSGHLPRDPAANGTPQTAFEAAFKAHNGQTREMSFGLDEFARLHKAATSQSSGHGSVGFISAETLSSAILAAPVPCELSKSGLITILTQSQCLANWPDKPPAPEANAGLRAQPGTRRARRLQRNRSCKAWCQAQKKSTARSPEANFPRSSGHGRVYCAPSRATRDSLSSCQQFRHYILLCVCDKPLL